VGVGAAPAVVPVVVACAAAAWLAAAAIAEVSTWIFAQV